MMNKFEPKSIRYRGELQKPFTDCSSFPKVDFSKFDFPIKIIESPMDIRVEKEVFSAIKRVGVNVDKDELLRALNYERDQYAAGFAAGVEATQPKWISVEEMLPEGKCIAVNDLGFMLIGYVRKRTDGKGYRCDDEHDVFGMMGVTHWMPLLEPPKEEV